MIATCNIRATYYKTQLHHTPGVDRHKVIKTNKEKYNK